MDIISANVMSVGSQDFQKKKEKLFTGVFLSKADEKINSEIPK